MAISTASTADPPVFKTFMANLAALIRISGRSRSRGRIYSLVAGSKMHHLVGYTVIASTGMDENAGRVTKLPSSLVGEHR